LRGYGQQDALFTQYYAVPHEFNPAAAGSRDGLSLALLTRIQWVGVSGAPRTTCLTASSPLRNDHIALGGYIYYDKTGPTVGYTVMGTFAYRVLFPSSRLSFGLSAGVSYFDIDWSALDPKDAGDLLLQDAVKNRAVPDADFGIYYSGKKFYAGISCRHLLQNQVLTASTGIDGAVSYGRLMRNYYALAGGSIPLTEELVLQPSGILRYVPGAPLQGDITVNLQLFRMFAIGASYRSEQAVCLIAGLVLPQGFTFGYSYDIWFNGLNSINKGSHEIRLGYDFDLFSRDRLLTPRYF
jgi:type IX secretion system PorP/SprF family membrane protein